jgi:hypothetical protein
MKKILIYLMLGSFALGTSSCKKFLDINENPNSPTAATPNLILPQAIVGSAAISNSYNSSFAYPGGFFANVFGVGGYGATLNYNYTSTSFNGLWSSTYDNALDYQYIINSTASDPTLAFSNGVAKIMKSFMFSKLVDNYNDVPYTDALKGVQALTPKYDNASEIYKDLVVQINAALTEITAGQADINTIAIPESADPMFRGNMDLWKRFGNTLKLRLLIKMAGVAALQSFTTPEFAAFDNSIGVLQDDALVNPGYFRQAGQVNPNYLFLAANELDVRSQGQVVPSTWMFSFYDGTKLDDSGRGSVIFRGFPNTATNQLGDIDAGDDIVSPSGSTSWFTGASFGTASLGVAKSPTQGQPVILLSEAKFLLAEAYQRGYLTGSAAEQFDAGVTASFRYLFKTQANVVDASYDVAESVAQYKLDNPDSYLVNFALTATPAAGDYNTNPLERGIEAIITQKYIAMNVINCDEAFAEYRRTKYPYIVRGSLDPTLTFASRASSSTSPDKLIVRLPYPLTEYAVNPGNVPANVNIFTAKVFWDVKN